MGEIDRLPTASAYCQARQKLKPELFLHLNSIVRDSFYELYEEEGAVRRWRGHRLLAVDGTRLNVPDTAETRAHFTVQANQFEGAERVQALGSILYDLLNDLGLDAAIGEKQGEKEFIFSDHWLQTEAGDVLIMDRGFADYAVMAFLAKHGREYLIRFPRHSYRAVNEFWADEGVKEKVVEIEAPPASAPSSTGRFVRDESLALRLRVRLIKVKLKTGEWEVLGTSLLDEQKYPTSEFKELYHKRWGVETYLDRIKNIFEVERFSGQNVHTIEQDFFGVIFLATLDGVLSKSADRELSKEGRKRKRQHRPQVNRSVSYSALLDHVIELLVDERVSIEEVLEELHTLFKTNPTLHRKGRSYPRTQLRASQKVWFYRYKKRINA